MGCTCRPAPENPQAGAPRPHRRGRLLHRGAAPQTTVAMHMPVPTIPRGGSSTARRSSRRAPRASLTTPCAKQCSSLVSFEIPASVTTIGGTAFERSSLVSVAIPTSVGHHHRQPRLRQLHPPGLGRHPHIGHQHRRSPASAAPPSAECTSLVSVEIPTSVTSIGSKSFYYTAPAGSRSVEIPTAVTSIGVCAFLGLTRDPHLGHQHRRLGLQPVHRPGLGRDLHLGRQHRQQRLRLCTSLVSVEIPASVASIGSRAFASCTRLVSVAIPTLVTSIGINAFTYCGCSASTCVASATVRLRLPRRPSGPARRPPHRGASANAHRVKNLTVTGQSKDPPRTERLRCLSLTCLDAIATNIGLSRLEASAVGATFGHRRSPSVAERLRRPRPGGVQHLQRPRARDGL